MACISYRDQLNPNKQSNVCFLADNGLACMCASPSPFSVSEAESPGSSAQSRRSLLSFFPGES